jgi:pilus assembly protein Flp/PilA
MKTIFARFAKDESGATAIEYGLIAALMAVVVIAAITILGPSLTGTFQGISDTLNNPTVEGVSP